MSNFDISNSNSYLGLYAGATDSDYALQNTYLGYLSGTNLVNSTKSTFLGATTSQTSGQTYTKSTAVGFGANVTASNQIVLGASSEYVLVPGNAAATAMNTGALQVAGGLGVSGDIYCRSVACSGFNSTTTPVINAATTLLASQSGSFLEFTYGPYTVTLPNPTGVNCQFNIWINTPSAITLSTPAGTFVGPAGNGGASIVITAANFGKYMYIASDKYNWFIYAANTVHSIPSSIAQSSNAWYSLGNFSGINALSDGGSVCKVVFTGHNGYNASTSQNYEAVINFKTSNGSVVNASGFAGDSTYTMYGPGVYDITPIWVGNAAGTSAAYYTLYVFLPSYPHNSIYTVYTSSNGAWTEIVANAAPSGTTNSSTVLVSSPVVLANSTVSTTSDNTNTTCYIPFTKAMAGTGQTLYVDDQSFNAPLKYNPQGSALTTGTVTLNGDYFNFVGGSNNTTAFCYNRVASAYSSSANAGDAVLRADTNQRLLLQTGAGNAAIIIDASNAVSIQNATTAVGANTQVTINSNAGGVSTTNTSTLDLRIQGAGGGMVDNTIVGKYYSVGGGNYGLAMNSYGTNVMNVIGNGTVGINTTSPAYPLDVNGVINTNSAINLSYSTVPTFTTSQIGYTVSYATTGTIPASGSSVTLTTPITLATGVYLMSPLLHLTGLVTGSTCGVTMSIWFNGNKYIDYFAVISSIGYVTMGTPVQTVKLVNGGAQNNQPITVTANTNSTSTCSQSGYIQFTRIA